MSKQYWASKCSAWKDIGFKKNKFGCHCGTGKFCFTKKIITSSVPPLTISPVLGIVGGNIQHDCLQHQTDIKHLGEPSKEEMSQVHNLKFEI